MKSWLHLPPVLAQRDAIFPAVVAAIVMMIVVSFATPRPKAEQLGHLS